MGNNPDNGKLLVSIRNALWMIVSILLLQTGFQLADLRKSPFAEFIMLLCFWIGFLLILITVIRIIESLFQKPGAGSARVDKGGRNDGDKPTAET